MADIKEIMQRQYGPMRVWMWTALVASFIAAFYVLRKKKTPAGSTTGGTGGTNGPAGQFTSGQSSTTTDAAGNQITTNYEASGPLTGFPGYITNQAGAMPYSGGDVYVNFPNNMPSGPPPNQTPPPPPQQTSTNTNLREQLNTSVFNTNGWTGDMFGAPWLMTTVNPGESWEDIVTRVYNFGAKYSDITDPEAKKRIDEVTPFIKDTNKAFTGLGPNGTGPAPGSVVFYR